MASAKYLGYVGGAAVAVGVGAAVAAASQGTAHADNTDTKTVSSEAKGPEKGPEKKLKPAAKLEKRLSKLAEDASPAVKTPAKTATKPAAKPKFDASDAVKNLQKKFQTAADDTKAKPPVEAVRDAPDKATDLATKATGVAQALVKMPTLQSVEADSTNAAATEAESSWYVPNTGPVPWSWNPLRADDPIPNDMPDGVWQLEQSTVGIFDSVPVVQPVVREGFELGYRLTQMVPWVNVVVPLSNIAQDIQPALSGDKLATQRIVNNLIVTTQPVSVLFYGYDEIADLVNLEWEAQQLKSWFYATSWNLVDWFGILHTKGESGLPLSPNPAGAGDNIQSVRLTSTYAAASATAGALAANDTGAADAPLTDPFRADDPWPTDMPDAVLAVEQSTVEALGGLPLVGPLAAPIYREAFEATYRFSQMVPYVNVPIPLATIIASLAAGDTTTTQTLINQLLLTTQPVSFLYYGYDEVADLLNVENSAYALKQQLYTTIWDSLDPTGALHPVGEPGI